MEQALRASLPSRAPALARRISDQGYAVVEDFVPLAELEAAQAFVADAVASNGGEYVGFTGTENLGETFLARLPNDPQFADLCRSLYESGFGGQAPEVSFYQVLRCLSGATARAHSLRFHFDSYALTALIPITMPGRGSAGRLLIHPNTRGIRRTYLANVADKVLCDNPLSQALLNAAYRRGSRRLIPVELKPGSVYLFWGYRSLHTNEPCEADAIRATALLHYADPHADSWLKRRWRPR